MKYLKHRSLAVAARLGVPLRSAWRTTTLGLAYHYARLSSIRRHFYGSTTFMSCTLRAQPR
jgi:hypothetical protein